jgi:hypothetical protein
MALAGLVCYCAGGWGRCLRRICCLPLDAACSAATNSAVLLVPSGDGGLLYSWHGAAPWMLFLPPCRCRHLFCMVRHTVRAWRSPALSFFPVVALRPRGLPPPRVNMQIVSNSGALRVLFCSCLCLFFKLCSFCMRENNLCYLPRTLCDRVEEGQISVAFCANAFSISPHILYCGVLDGIRRAVSMREHGSSPNAVVETWVTTTLPHYTYCLFMLLWTFNGKLVRFAFSAVRGNGVADGRTQAFLSRSAPSIHYPRDSNDRLVGVPLGGVCGLCLEEADKCACLR